MAKVLWLVSDFSILLNEVWKPNLILVALSKLDDAKHGLAVGVWEVVDDHIDPIRDDADSLGLKSLCALLDGGLVLDVLSSRDVPLLQQCLALDLDRQLVSVSEVAPASLLLDRAGQDLTFGRLILDERL